jgi:hypothetical protein
LREDFVAVNTKLIDRGFMFSTGPEVEVTLIAASSYGRIEKIKARLSVKVEHPFLLIKCQFWHLKALYRGLAKNTIQLLVMFEQSNFCLVRKRVIEELRA